MFLRLFSFVFASLLLSSCWQISKPPQLSDSGQFMEYWYRSKGEINVFDLYQAQDGNYHKGQLINIYVTEPFRFDKQVKNEKSNLINSINNVLKLNTIRRYTTGVSDVSAMTSVFVPVSINDFEDALKASCSVQDWCGQSYSQLNFGQNGYNYMSRSYFESEATEQYHVNKALSEDELMVIVRLRPERIKTGNQMVLPSLFSARMRHQKLKPILAQIKLYEYRERRFRGSHLQTLELDYKGDERNVKIVYENIFPYKIVGMEETQKEGDQFMTTYAILNNTQREAYWNQNNPADSLLRKRILNQ